MFEYMNGNFPFSKPVSYVFVSFCLLPVGPGMIISNFSGIESIHFHVYPVKELKNHFHVYPFIVLTGCIDLFWNMFCILFT